MTAATVLAASLIVAQSYGAYSHSGDLRVDTFDQHGNRTGYFVINPNSGRVDQYDVKSNRLGHGQATTSGRIDFYDTRGNRTGYETVTPFRSNGNGSKR